MAMSASSTQKNFTQLKQENQAADQENNNNLETFIKKITEINSSLKTQIQTNLNLDKEVERQDGEIGNLDKKIQELNNTVAEKNNVIDERDKEIAALKKERLDIEKKYNELQRQREFQLKNDQVQRVGHFKKIDFTLAESEKYKGQVQQKQK